MIPSTKQFNLIYRVILRLKRWLLLEEIIVPIIALLVTVATTINFFYYLVKMPVNTVYVGMTHYFEDFFYYLDHFAQGALGNWLVYNNFTSERSPGTLNYLDNLIMGKIGGLLGLTPFLTYNIFLLILKFCYLILSYQVIRLFFPENKKHRLVTYILFIFSTTLPFPQINQNGLSFIYPIRVFRTENLIVTRFPNIPHTYVINILFLLILILMIKLLSSIREKNSDINIKLFKILFPLSLCLTFLTLFDAIKAVILYIVFLVIGSLHLLYTKNNKNYSKSFIISTIVLSIFFIGALVYFAISIAYDPAILYANNWDINEYVKQFSLLYWYHYFFAFGLITIFFIFGFPEFLRRKKNIAELFVLLIAIIGLIGYFFPYFLQIPLPGFRFIFSSSYIFFAVIALYGLISLKKLTHFKFTPIILIIIYLSINLSVFSTSFKEMTTPLKEPDYHFMYMPNDVYNGLQYLKKLEPKNALVLASSHTGMDVFIPGFSGKRSYTGHFLITIKSEEKEKLNNNFFFTWTSTSPEAIKFLKDNGIRYIFNTSYEATNNFQTRYPFLKKVYENNAVKIFEYKLD